MMMVVVVVGIVMVGRRLRVCIDTYLMYVCRSRRGGWVG